MSTTYSIKELESLTGIRAHTIRIWEQRYALLKPVRTDTNIRRYTDEELKLMLNVALLNKNGYKISKIARMTEEEIRQKVLEVSTVNHDFSNQINALSVAMIALNEDEFERLLSANILRTGFEDTFQNIIFPFLDKTGILWQLSLINPAQEHFVSNIIRQKIIVATNELAVKRIRKAPRALLFLSENELHELPLLYTNYILRKYGFFTLYLGGSVPLACAKAAAESYKSDIIFTGCTLYPRQSEIKSYLTALHHTFTKHKIFISGRQLTGLKLTPPANISILEDISEGAECIKKLAREIKKYFFFKPLNNFPKGVLGNNMLNSLLQKISLPSLHEATTPLGLFCLKIHNSFLNRLHFALRGIIVIFGITLKKTLCQHLNFRNL